MHWAACQPECSPFQRLQNLTHHIKKKLASGTFTVIQMKEKLPPARYYIPLICSLEMLCVLACYFKVFSPSCFEVIQFVLHELFFFFFMRVWPYQEGSRNTVESSHKKLWDFIHIFYISTSLLMKIITGETGYIFSQLATHR